MIKGALEFITSLKEAAMKPEVIEIDGKTYCTKNLTRYDIKPKAETIAAKTLTSLVDYITEKSDELRESMILHVFRPDVVRLYSGLDEERERETLFVAEAEIPYLKFDSWTDQERFIIDLQANFKENDDLRLLLKVAGSVEAKSVANYGDDGVSQKATISSGIASRTDVVAPNPVNLIPYRTFLEVEQPASNFVFRISDKGSGPAFKLIEAEGGLWKNEAMENIKSYLQERLADSPVRDRITII